MSGSAPLSPPQQYRRRFFLCVSLFDFDTSPSLYDILHPRVPLNLDVLSLFADHRPRVFPREYPPLREDHWDPRNPNAIRDYQGEPVSLLVSPVRAVAGPALPGPPASVDSSFLRWLLNLERGPIRGLRLEPRRHQYFAPRRPLGSSPTNIPASFSLADMAHEIFLSYALQMWYSVQVLGPHRYAVMVIWARRRESSNNVFRYSATAPPIDLAARLQHEMDILAATIDLFEGDPATNAEELANRIVSISSLSRSSSLIKAPASPRALSVLPLATRCLGRVFLGVFNPPGLRYPLDAA